MTVEYWLNQIPCTHTLPPLLCHLIFLYNLDCSSPIENLNNESTGEESTEDSCKDDDKTDDKKEIKNQNEHDVPNTNADKCDDDSKVEASASDTLNTNNSKDNSSKENLEIKDDVKENDTPSMGNTVTFSLDSPSDGLQTQNSVENLENVEHCEKEENQKEKEKPEFVRLVSHRSLLEVRSVQKNFFTYVSI